MYVYVCTFVCCCHTRMLVHACVSVYSSFVHMHVYTYACLYMYNVYAQGLGLRDQGRIFICMYICMHMCMYVNTYVEVFM